MPFYVIEKESQIEKIPEFKECYIHVITNNDRYHPYIADVSLVYVRPFNDKGYMFCIKHGESLSLKWQYVRKFLSDKKLYSLDAKYSKYFFSGNINDIGFNIRKEGADIDVLENKPAIITDFYRRMGDLKNINEVIPISKHYEYMNNIYSQIKPYIFENNDLEYKTTNMFYKIEREGIRLDKEYFIKFFGDIPEPQFSIKKGKIYSQYNLHTYTGRPSNSFNGINFLSLSREKGERRAFIPNNDVFIEYDMKAFHPRLLGNLIGYSFKDNDDVYKILGNILEIEDTSRIKETTFQCLYGNIGKNIENKPFFKDIKSYTEEIWREFNNKGNIENASGRLFRLKDIDSPTPSKLLNYLLQNKETVENVTQIHALFGAFRAIKSRIVLYSYDSVLIDALSEEADEILNILSQLKYPGRIKMGLSYNELK